VREARSRYDVDKRASLDVFVRSSEAVAQDFQALAPFITALAGVGRLECGPATAKPKQAAMHVHPEFEAYVSLEGLIVVAAEIARKEKQRADLLRRLEGARAKLGNSSFVDRAPPEVVQQQRDLVVELQNQIQAIEDNLRELRQG
jgi:valyl-tRNA synthetase